MRGFIAAVSLFAGTLLPAANPLNFTEFTQTVEVRFNTPEEAQAAGLVFLPLPEDKKLAFSTRWDDTNPRHARMAELLTKYGWKGTFYLSRPSGNFNREVLPELTSNGHSVGNHTLSHPRLPLLLPNEVWREIHLNRLLVENASGTPVNTFVLPFCDYRNGFDADAEHTIGSALRRSGEIGSPEFFPRLEQEYGYPAGTFANSYLFSPDDRDPKPELFDRRVTDGLKKVADPASGVGPHLTLGLHTWQSDAGFATLGRCLERYARNPDWWYCNENEYAAYRYDRNHSKVVGKSVEGPVARFELSRIAPRTIGAAVPLWVEVTPAPADGKSRFALPPAPPALGVPEKVGLLRNIGNQPAAESMMKAENAPVSIGFSIDFPKKILEYRLTNTGDSQLERPVVTFRQPPGRTRGAIRRELAALDPGHTLRLELPLGDETGREIDRPGPLLWSAQLDFATGGHPERVHATVEIDQPFRESASPRDTALVLGPLSRNSFTDSFLSAASKPDGEPPTLQDALHGRWFKTEGGKELRPGVVRLRAADAGWKKSAQLLRNGNDPDLRLAALVEFHAPRAAAFRLFTTPGEVEALYLNGRKLDFDKQPPREIPVDAGLNRLLVLYRYTRALPEERYLSAGPGESPDDHFEFRLPVRKPAAGAR